MNPGRSLVIAFATFACGAGCGDSTPVQRTRPAEPRRETAEQSTALVAVTPRAAEVIKKAADASSWHVRIRVIPGGCTGIQQKLDIDPVTSPQNDHVFESGGVPVVVWKAQRELLRGARVDYGTKLGQQGFIITIPNLEGVDKSKWVAMINPGLPGEPPLTAEERADRVEALRIMAAESPDSAHVHLHHGRALADVGRTGDAVKSLERTIQLVPSYLEAYPLLGKCLAQLDQKARAVEVLRAGYVQTQDVESNAEIAIRDDLAAQLKDLGATLPSLPSKSRSER